MEIIMLLFRKYKATNEGSLKPKALIFYVHGYGDYGSRYAFVGKYLS